MQTQIEREVVEQLGRLLETNTHARLILILRTLQGVGFGKNPKLALNLRQLALMIEDDEELTRLCNAGDHDGWDKRLEQHFEQAKNEQLLNTVKGGN